MTRTLFWPSTTILFLGLLALPACGQQDTAEAVIADCSGHVPREKVDSCLERARVIDETNPSANLQSLEAELQRRALRHERAQGAPPLGYDPNQPPPGYAQEQGPPPGQYGEDQPSQPDGSEEPPPQSDEDANEAPPPQDYAPHPPGPGYHQQPHDYGDQSAPPEGPRGDVMPPADQTGPGDLSPPDEGPQGPPPDNTPPPDDSETQGPGQ